MNSHQTINGGPTMYQIEGRSHGKTQIDDFDDDAAAALMDPDFGSLSGTDLVSAGAEFGARVGRGAAQRIRKFEDAAEAGASQDG